eukprot:UN33461
MATSWHHDTYRVCEICNLLADCEWIETTGWNGNDPDPSGECHTFSSSNGERATAGSCDSSGDMKCYLKTGVSSTDNPFQYDYLFDNCCRGGAANWQNHGIMKHTTCIGICNLSPDCKWIETTGWNDNNSDPTGSCH